MKKNIAIVFDCGATNVRVIAMNDQGVILASKSMSNETNEDPYLSEGRIWDVKKLWAKLCLASRDVVSKIDTTLIAGVTFTTFGVDGTFVDEKGDLLYPVISWQCNRTVQMVEEVQKYISTERLYELSGVYPYAFNTIYKMVWFKENKPEILEKAHRFLFIPSLLAMQLSGAMNNDATMMGTSMMNHLGDRTFSKEVLDALDLNVDLFGDIKEPGMLAGEVTADGSRMSGIPMGTPLYTAGHDTQFAIYGSGAALNQPVLSSGTWEILMGRSKTKQRAKLSIGSKLTTELDAMEGVCNIGQNWLGSGVLEWFFRHFYPDLKGEELYNQVAEDAQKVEAGKHGLLVDPSFYKEQIGDKGGRILGITLQTSRQEIYSAFIESLSFRLREALESLQKAGGYKAEKIICVGGGSKNALWNQIRADVCQIPIQVIEQKETTVLGAALFVFYGSGLYPSVEAAREAIDYNPQLVLPSKEKETFWDECYKNYLNLKNN